MKTIGKFFLGLAVIIILIQPSSAEVFNQSSNQSGIQANSSTLISTNFTFNETSSNASKSQVVSNSHSVSSSQSVANYSSQITVSLAAESLDNVGISSNEKSHVMFITDLITSREYVADQVIVRFKSPNNGDPSFSDDKIGRAHAKVGAKVKKDFSAEG